MKHRLAIPLVGVLLLAGCSARLAVPETTRITVHSKVASTRVTTDPGQIRKLSEFLSEEFEWKRKNPFELGNPNQALSFWFKDEIVMVLRFSDCHIWTGNRDAPLSDKQKTTLEQLIEEMRFSD